MGSPFLNTKNSETVYFFKDVYTPFMSVVFLSYSFSGYYKLHTPRWIDGSFLSHFLVKNHLLLPWMESFYVPAVILAGLTYVTLYLEALAFTAIFHPSFRFFIWTGLTAMHVGLLCITELTQVSLGMLVIHLFLIDELTWKVLKLDFLTNTQRYLRKEV